MKISVITVAFNAAATIEATIASVHEQDYGNIEHIIIDGASTDGSLEILARYEDKISCLVSEKDGGIYDAMNKGLARASGDVAGFLNADDTFIDKSVLSKIGNVFQDSSIDLCYGDVVYFSSKNPLRIIRHYRSGECRDGAFQKGWMPAHPTFYARCEVYEKYGGFDTQFKLQADFDLTMRFMEIHKIRTVYIPEVLVRMRMGGASNKNICNVIRGNLEAYRACGKNGMHVGPLFIVRKILSRLPQFFMKP